MDFGLPQPAIWSAPSPSTIDSAATFTQMGWFSPIPPDRFFMPGDSGWG